MTRNQHPNVLNGSLGELELVCFRRPLPYRPVLRRMEARIARIAKGTAAPALWFLEHTPVYTAGTSADETEYWADTIKAIRDVPVVHTGRGGRYTFHGPGQRVVYIMTPVRDRRGHLDLRGFIDRLQTWVIAALACLDVAACTRSEAVGVWVARDGGGFDKIAAVGLRVRRTISYHGVAINVDPDMAYYKGILPCGIRKGGVTSLRRLGLTGSRASIMARLDQALAQTFIQVWRS
ncbi:MAG: lipoyl(octanoyl) transferase LipB [Pseudomonadota bacterium]